MTERFKLQGKRGRLFSEIVTGGATVKEANEIKKAAIEIFEKAKFELHKWGSNVRELEQTAEEVDEEGRSYAKQQLGTVSGESSLLGLVWNKREDTIGISFSSEKVDATRRGILKKVARVYDPLGIVSPVTLCGKILYRDACDEKRGWDAKLSDEVTKRWKRWEDDLPKQVAVPRSIPKHQGEIEDIALHAFGDASGKGVAAVVYAVVKQCSGSSKGLVAAKARLAKKGLTIPRLELVSGHMASNLAHNVREALAGFTVSGVYCSRDSTVALHWIRRPGDYKQFVSNRVRKIQERGQTTWRHVGMKDDPADLASRGGNLGGNQESWLQGPIWLETQENWPKDIITTTSEATLAETKATKTLFGIVIEEKDDLDGLMVKWDFWKALRTCAWIARFVFNTRVPNEERRMGTLTTGELDAQRHFWERRTQSEGEMREKYEEDRLQLNLQPNEDGLLECRGRIQGHYPIYLPDNVTYTEKFVQWAHESTLHGGVGLTMAKVREKHWVPRLRRLAKSLIKKCPKCKRFQVTALASPPPGLLPKDRTEGDTPFQVVGVDFAGPIKIRVSQKREGKAYVVVYSCSLSRALHLDLTKTMEMEEFLLSLKGFVARRGRPEKVYSDNGRTFVGAAAWMKKVRNDERLNDFLVHQGISWQFNLSRAPWWGGQFERMVGLVKGALRKSVGGSLLTFDELKEALLDVETALNNRPLSYVEDDVQMPTLTPASILHPRSNVLPELETHHEENASLRKRAKYLKRCKDVMWRRWTNEYLRGLRERHNLKFKGAVAKVKRGDVVIIKGDEKDRNQWKLGIVEEPIPGKDGIVRAVRLRAGKNHLERAVQHLYPLELSCDREEANNRLNPEHLLFDREEMQRQRQKFAYQTLQKKGKMTELS